MSAVKPTPRPPGDRGQGRRRFTPTDSQRRLVTVLRGVGTSAEAIAREIGCSTSTLHLRFGPEMASGKESVIARIATKLVQRAMQGHFPSQAFYLARFGGDAWRQTSRHELTGADGLALTPPDLVVNFIGEASDDASKPVTSLVLQPGGRPEA